MKKILPFLLLLALFIGACKKDGGKKPNPTPPEDKTYSVKFNVSGLSGAMSSVNGKKTNAISAPGVGALYYFAFNSQGTLVHRFIQDSTAANFGTVEDFLPAGTYTIVLFAGKDNLKYTDKALTQAALTPVSGWSDSFYKKVTVTVNNGAINQNVNLDRVTGKLALKFLDPIPPNAAKLKISHSGAGPFMLTGTTASAPGSFTVTIPPSAIGKPNFTMSTFVMPVSSPYAVNIKCYDSANTLLADITVNDVVVERNKQTILSGNLFNSDNTFTINLDQSWNTPINIQF